MFYILINSTGQIEIHEDTVIELPIGAVQISREQADGLVAGVLTFNDGVIA